MAEPITISFAGDTEIKSTLEDWAKQNERSVSWIIRKLIEAEKVRRMQQLPLAIVEDEAETPYQQMRAHSVPMFGN